MFFCLGLPVNEVMPRLKEKVMDFKQGMPVITSLRNSSLRLRHWELIERLIGKAISRDKFFTLGSLLDMNVRFKLMMKYVYKITIGSLFVQPLNMFNETF